MIVALEGHKWGVFNMAGLTRKIRSAMKSHMLEERWLLLVLFLGFCMSDTNELRK